MTLRAFIEDILDRILNAIRKLHIEITNTTLTGSIVSFVSKYVGLPLKSHTVALTATQSGSGTPSPQNIRSINGYREINNTATGKNIVDFNSYLMTRVSDGLIMSTTADGGIRVHGTSTAPWSRITETIPVFLPKGYSYTFSISEPLTHRTYLEAGYDNGTTSPWMIARSDTSVTITPDTNVISLRLTYSGLEISQSYDETIYPMVELGSTATEWTPNNGTYTTIQIGSTVYGGEYDARTGVLTVTHGNIASYNGEAINEPWISSMDKYIEGGTPTIGAQVVYPLTTPTTIQLPPCPINTLEGVNNIWADTGETTIVTIEPKIKGGN